ncbi:MAG: pantoate--beta-alanine ligase [Chloroflexi bacterium]|nr:pantoate--beta-alanine ligase [Chloroflexota bacterium]
MIVCETVSSMKKARRQMAGRVGCVPTMGYLHEGHLTLLSRARQENDHVVATIFVNPTQFGPHEDLASYPRNPQRDLAMLEGEGIDAVFMPSPEEMYPAGYATYINVEGLTDRLEGASRPGHFRGVATVVAKLFNTVEPHRAYFGQKDAQQLLVIKRMAADLDMNVQVLAVPTVREPDGLAMSSRNTHLSPQERQAATVLYRALTLARELWRSGERDAERLRRQIIELIQKEPLASIDYVSVADPDSLEELAHINSTALVSMAVRIGRTRLIDNTLLGGQSAAHP